MAKKFNNTNYPFLNFLGMDYNLLRFHESIFKLNAFDSGETNKSLENKRAREWYDSHNDNFSDRISIFANNKFDFDFNKIHDLTKSCGDTKDISGVVMFPNKTDIAFLYTIMFHSDEWVEKKRSEGYRVSNVEAYIMMAGISKGFKMVFSNCFHALMYTSTEKDMLHVEAVYSSGVNVNDKSGIETIERMFSYALNSALCVVAAHHYGIGEIYDLPHGKEISIEGNPHTYINYTKYNVEYVCSIRRNDVVQENEIMASCDSYTLYKGGPTGYYMSHIPIDYVLFGKNVYGDNWGLTTIFNPLKEDDAMYKKLRDHFYDDRPLFIGRMLMPLIDAGDNSITLHKVYVVRCESNGTTYFASDDDKALKPFCN